MIHFVTENIDLPDIKQNQTISWIKKIVAKYGKSVGEIHYIFCNDDKILDVNRQFLNHDYYTDIITFDYTIGKQLSADIFISTQTVADNARKTGTDFSTELNRVIIHGILHLCGYNDATEKEQITMRKMEDEALKSFF